MNLDYGLGEAFWRNFDRAAQDPKCYSTLVKPSNWKYGGRSTFGYKRASSAAFAFRLRSVRSHRYRQRIKVSAPPLLSVRGLTVRKGKVTLLENVSRCIP